MISKPTLAPFLLVVLALAALTVTARKDTNSVDDGGNIVLMWAR